jgi:hypothetical protein
MFTSGSTKQSVACTLCKSVTYQQNNIDEIILKSHSSHHDIKSRNKSCTLGDMLMYYVQMKMMTTSARHAIGGCEQQNVNK